MLIDFQVPTLFYYYPEVVYTNVIGYAGTAMKIATHNSVIAADVSMNIQDRRTCIS
jgi:hypothetical protein